VVNPPNNPVLRNSTVLADNEPRVISHALSAPAMKQPNRFTVRVAHGNRPGCEPIATPTRKRALAPIAPPAATLKRFTMEVIGIEIAFGFRGLYRKMAERMKTTITQVIACSILLIGSASVQAEKLYRWIEPDGSITFSPNPPPAGVDYKTVNSATGENTQLPKQQNAVTASSAAPAQAPAAPTKPVTISKLNYAPETSSAPARRVQTPKPAVAAATAANPAAQAAAKKQRQCQDLGKRVVSLERRLRSLLTPEDMDNTVLAMARYQKSFDRFCVK